MFGAWPVHDSAPRSLAFSIANMNQQQRRKKRLKRCIDAPLSAPCSPIIDDSDQDHYDDSDPPADYEEPAADDDYEEPAADDDDPQAKIRALEAQLAQKDEIIGAMQRGNAYVVSEEAKQAAVDCEDWLAARIQDAETDTVAPLEFFGEEFDPNLQHVAAMPSRKGARQQTRTVKSYLESYRRKARTACDIYESMREDARAIRRKVPQAKGTKQRAVLVDNLRSAPRVRS